MMSRLLHLYTVETAKHITPVKIALMIRPLIVNEPAQVSRRQIFTLPPVTSAIMSRVLYYMLVYIFTIHRRRRETT
jgi:hypothetical protein